jgi:hypothetical protein
MLGFMMNFISFFGVLFWVFVGLVLVMLMLMM